MRASLRRDCAAPSVPNMTSGTEAGRAPDDLDEDTDEDDEDEDEDEDETGDPVDVSPPPVALRPIRPRARAAPPIPAGALSNFGGVPQSATHWAMTRRTPIGNFEPLAWAPPGSSVAVREWPLAELSEKEVEARWGLGCYRVQWIAPTVNGGRKYLRAGLRTFDIVRPTPIPSAEPAPSSPSSAAPDPFGGAFQLMDLIERRTDGKLDSLVKLSSLLGGGSSRGISPEEMRAIIRDEREAAEKARLVELAAVEARWAAKLAEFEGEDDGPDIAGAVIGAAPRMKGSGWLANTLNFAQANPELAKVAVQGGLPIVLAAVSSLAALFTPKAAAAPAPNPAPLAVVRPRAQARPVDAPIVTPPRSNGSPWAPQPTEAAPAGAELGGEVVPSS